ncbi:hypothetical protein N7481_011451 [Penicillium waksmanii]|uniref:uncharacterized protein n=1 Tax=Penicillium waksmanii TaxID=69791 RepID=UPI0025489576|nr:uncharacterized protein N7481_011451 [Penicillium waksmanii]KAJ5974241.1 hypothetical protein N7481_011451 [Penicillium waksmanii]
MGQQDKSKPFLPLAPGPPRIDSRQSTEEELHGLPSMQDSKAKGKLACSGPPSPCKACVGANVENDCHFDPSRDLRRKVAVKRTIQELSDVRDLLESLLSTVRLATPDKIGEVVGVIKSNGSMCDIAFAVGCPVTNFTDSASLSNASQLSNSEEGEQVLESPMGENFGAKARRPSEISVISTSPERDHHIEMPGATFDPYARVSLESLCNIPLYEVPAKPWTEVTNDDSLVSVLVSLYFTWDHPCAQFLDQGIFVEHMKSRDVESEFCTPLLVNSLLSMASAHCDSPHNYPHMENECFRGETFFAEAERLWKAQEGRPSLPNIQALLLMCSVLSCQGKANLGWLMLQQAVQLARDMDLLILPEAPNSKHMFKYDITPDMEHVRNITAWGISSLNGQMSMKLKKVATLSQPATKIDTGGDHDFDWIPYPRSNHITYTTKRAHLPEVRQGLAELTDIMLHIEKLRYDKELNSDFDLLMARAEVPYHQLQEWLVAWPSTSQIGIEPVSQILILRIKCVHVIMHLIELLVERDYQSSKTSQLQETWLAQVKEMAQCLRIHRQSYGIKHIPSQVADAVQGALRVLVHRLEDLGEAKQAFIELCRFGVAMGQRFKSTAETIQTIQSLSSRGSVMLPKQAIAILNDSE